MRFHTDDGTFGCRSLYQAVQLVQILDTLIVNGHQFVQIRFLLGCILRAGNQGTQNFGTIRIGTYSCDRGFCKYCFPGLVGIFEVVSLYIFTVNTDVLQTAETVFAVSESGTALCSCLSKRGCCTE